MAQLPIDTWVDQVANPWQRQYAQPDWQEKLTKLSPEEEQAFTLWAAQNKVPITPDYDMKGFWKNGGMSAVSPVDGKLHYTDKYKTPLHESFSGESIYSLPDIPKPTWNEKNQLVSPEGVILFDEPAVVKRRCE